MGILILRSSAGVAPGGDWADVFTTAANAYTQLGTDGRIVGIRGSSTSDYAASVTPDNGGSVTRLANSSFDSAEDALHVVPPDAEPGGGAQYCGILVGVQLTPSGVNTIRQLNWRWLAYHGSTYWSHSSNSKVTGVLMSAVNSSPGASVKRAAIFDQQWAPPTEEQKVFGVTYGTTQSYHEPDSGIDAGDEEDKLFYLRSSANHSNDPPILGAEWVCFEQVVTTPGYNGQTDGRNKLYVWTRDGLVSAASLDIPFSYAGDYDPTKIYITDTEYLGGYFNDAGLADPDNFMRYSHCAFASNMGASDVIGPPPGFLL
jgi:hypothetical protein